MGRWYDCPTFRWCNVYFDRLGIIRWDSAVGCWLGLRAFQTVLYRITLKLWFHFFTQFTKKNNPENLGGISWVLVFLVTNVVVINKIQGIPVFRDFTIGDPLYFMIQFQALNSWIPLHFMILKKKIPKKKFFQKFFQKISDFQQFWIAFCLYTVIATD